MSHPLSSNRAVKCAKVIFNRQIFVIVLNIVNDVNVLKSIGVSGYRAVSYCRCPLHWTYHSEINRDESARQSSRDKGPHRLSRVVNILDGVLRGP